MRTENSNTVTAIMLVLEFLIVDLPGVLKMIPYCSCSQAAACYLETISQNISGYLVIADEEPALDTLSDCFCHVLQALKDRSLLSPQVVVSTYNCLEYIKPARELTIEFTHVYLMVFQQNQLRYQTSCDDEGVRREFEAYFRVFVNFLSRELGTR